MKINCNAKKKINCNVTKKINCTADTSVLTEMLPIRFNELLKHTLVGWYPSEMCVQFEFCRIIRMPECALHFSGERFYHPIYKS